MSTPLRSLALTLLTVIAIGGLASGADSVLFDEPRAQGDFGESVEFSTTFRSEVTPRRVELLTRQPGGSDEFVDIAAVQQGPGDTWTASAFRGGHIVPNTSWEYRFRVITNDGAVTGPTASHRVVDERFDWQRLEGELVDVWWYDGGDAFGRRALAFAEEALASSSELLGVEDMEPMDFFIYSDDRDFREAMGPATRENTGGQAHPAIRTLFGLISPRQIDSDWVDELLSHELAHLVFHEAVDNPYQYPPRWLNEGVAVYLSRGYTNADKREVEGAASMGTIIPLEGLTGNFPTRGTRISLAYAESVSAVDYLVETHGEDHLVQLITSFAEGTGVDDAFVAATGADFAAFDSAWLASLGAATPEPYGPTETEPGPMPSDWVGGVPQPD